MKKNRGKPMRQSDNRRRIFTDSDYRYQVFANVFEKEEGREVLEYLDAAYRISDPDFENSARIYYQLGRQSVINQINNILTYGAKKHE